MNWILDHSQIVILIALALASWVKRRMDMKQAGQELRPDSGEVTRDEDVFGSGPEWEQSLPADPPPLVRTRPPPVVRQTVRAAMPVLPVDHEVMQVRQQQVRDTKASITGGAAATRSRVSAAQTHAKAVQPIKSGLRESLKKRKDIRRAIIMREILGPPVGLR